MILNLRWCHTSRKLVRIWRVRKPQGGTVPFKNHLVPSAPLGTKKRGTYKGLYRNYCKIYTLGCILAWGICSKHTEWCTQQFRATEKLFSTFYMLLFHACPEFFLFFYGKKVALVILYGRVCKNFARPPGIMQNCIGLITCNLRKT